MVPALGTFQYVFLGLVVGVLEEPAASACFLHVQEQHRASPSFSCPADCRRCVMILGLNRLWMVLTVAFLFSY